MEGIEDEDGLGQRVGRDLGEVRLVERVDEWLDVVAALHGAKQEDGVLLRDERRLGVALGDGGEESRLDVGGLVDAGWHAHLEHLEQLLAFIRRRLLEQLHERCRLGRIERLGHDAHRGALSHLFLVVGHEGRRHAHGAEAHRRRRSTGLHEARRPRQHRKAQDPLITSLPRDVIKKTVAVENDAN